jgi:hypothetical protein
MASRSCDLLNGDKGIDFAEFGGSLGFFLRRWVTCWEFSRTTRASTNEKISPLNCLIGLQNHRRKLLLGRQELDREPSRLRRG